MGKTDRRRERQGRVSEVDTEARLLALESPGFWAQESEPLIGSLGHCVLWFYGAGGRRRL